MKIEFTNVPRDSYADQMTTLFASGSPPDIVHLASFEFQSFADNGWLEDLDPWIKKSGLDLKGWAGQKVCHFEDHDYCIMLLYFGYVMAYNQDMLDAAGLKVPTNWDEYLAAAKKLTIDKSKNGLTDQYGVGISTAAGGGQYLSELLVLCARHRRLLDQCRGPADARHAADDRGARALEDADQGPADPGRHAGGRRTPSLHRGQDRDAHRRALDLGPDAVGSTRDPRRS